MTPLCARSPRGSHTHSPARNAPPLPCTPVPLRLHFFSSYGSSSVADSFPTEELNRLLNTASPVDAAAAGPLVTIYASNGIGFIPDPKDPVQDELLANVAWREMWNKSLTAARRHAATRLIFGTVGAHEGTMKSQTPQAIAKYNEWLRGKAAEHSDLVELLDVAAFTRGLPSQDGIHFMSHDNVALAQLLLNLLAESPPPAVLAQRAGAADRRRPGAIFRDGPLILYHDQRGVDEATSWYVGSEYELRGCRCYPDWQARAARNASASLCHCRGWCPPRVTPETLTRDTAGCQDVSGVKLHTVLGGTCIYDCRGAGGGSWQAEGPSARLPAQPEPSELCRDCKRNAAVGAPSAAAVV